jgi:hypothetical protein
MCRLPWRRPPSRLRTSAGVATSLPSSPLRSPLTSWRGAAVGRGAVAADPAAACLENPTVVGSGGGRSRCVRVSVCVFVCVSLCVRRRRWRVAATARRWRAAATTRWWGRGGPCAFFSKTTFAESNCGLSAHMHREGDPRLSTKGPLPAGLHRVAFAESFLSVKALP